MTGHHVPGRATRVDIVTVRDPDWSNEYTVFVNGEDISDSPDTTGGYVVGLPMANELRVEIWDVDLGRADLGVASEWAEWKYSSPGWDEDLKIPAAVRACIDAIARRVAESFGHNYPNVRNAEES